MLTNDQKMALEKAVEELFAQAPDAQSTNDVNLVTLTPFEELLVERTGLPPQVVNDAVVFDHLLLVRRVDGKLVYPEKWRA